MGKVELRDERFPALVNKHVLVVEDEPIIAVNYHFQLADVGARPVAFRGTSEAALAYLSGHDVDVAKSTIGSARGLRRRS